MRIIRADFASPARWPVVLLQIGAVAAVAAACWMSVVAARRYETLSAARAHTTALRAELATSRAVQASRAASAVAVPGFAPDARRWMNLSEFDAGATLRSIESAQVVGAKVLSLEIDAASRHSDIELEVASAESATDYLQALNAGLVRPEWTLGRLQIQGGSELAVIHGMQPRTPAR